MPAGRAESGAGSLRQHIGAVPHAIPTIAFPQAVGYAFIGCYTLLVLVTLMAYASHPRFGKIPVLAGILSASVLVPWGLELIGVLEGTYSFRDGALTLSSSVVQFSSVPVQLAMAAVLVSLIGVVAVLTRGLAMRQRDAARKLELHAWQLRQIVPVAPR